MTGAVTSVVNITINGKTTQVNLDEIGNVYGSFDCKATATTNCTVASTSTSSSGFQGTYGTSDLVSTVSRRRLRQMYGEAFIDEQDSEGLSEAKTFNEYTSQAQEQWLFNGSFFLNSSSFRDHLNK